MRLKPEELPNFKHIERQIVRDDSGRPLFFNYSIHFKTYKFLASGSHENDEIAKKKAYSEANERIFFTLADPEIRKSWKFQNVNSTDCMAAGFTKANTITRSNLEAVERSCRLLLKETSLSLKKVSIPIELPTVLQGSTIDPYYTKVEYLDFRNSKQTVYFSLSAYKTELGIFTGFGCDFSLENSVTQSIIEAKRNKTYFLNLDEDKRKFILTKEKSAFWGLNFSDKNVLKDIDLTGDGKVPTTVLPKINWQILCKFGQSFICRSFITGFETKNIKKLAAREDYAN